MTDREKERAMNDQIASNHARQQAALNQAGSLLGAQHDPEWKSEQEKRERQYQRREALDFAMRNTPGAPSDAIIAEADKFLSYLSGDHLKGDDSNG